MTKTAIPMSFFQCIEDFTSRGDDRLAFPVCRLLLRRGVVTLHVVFSGHCLGKVGVSAQQRYVRKVQVRGEEVQVWLPLCL